MATKQKISTPFPPGNQPKAADTMTGMGNKNDSGGGVNKEPAYRQKQSQISEEAPSMFDLFYEEFLTNVMKDKELSEQIPKEFVQLQSDYERVEYLLRLSPSILLSF